MATSSIHKPGWRSRRRSRLSLVERAVPRLGLPAEPDETSNVPSSEKRPRQEPAQPGTNGNGMLAASASHDTDALGSSERLETAEPPVLSPNGTISTAEPPATGHGASADTAFVSASSSKLANATASSRDEADESEKNPSGMSMSATGTVLELEWDRLIENGFVDPRDRARPLSKTMDEIIRALIRQALSDQSGWRDRVVLVTSPIERSSKTTASINFAFGLTTVANHHAVLVDVDTVGLGAVGRLGGSDRVGIATALADESIAVDQLPIRTDLDRLTLVASGNPDEDTLDRFASRRMLEVLRYLTKNPETILIIDAPPILLSQEAAVLSVVAGQVVMSVEAGKTTEDQIEHALQRIGERHNVSLVLNESCGIGGSDTPAIAGFGEPIMESQRTPGNTSGNRRRLPRTAAAMGAAMLGFLCAQPSGHDGAVLDSLLFPSDPAASIVDISMPAVAPPERLSKEVAQTPGLSCHQVCR